MAQETVQQLASLVQLLTALTAPDQPDSERATWLASALRGKRNLVQYLGKLILDDQRTKNEHRLAILLLSMIVRLSAQIGGDERNDALRRTVLADLSSIEGMWLHIHELVVQGGPGGVATSVNAIGLFVCAYILNRDIGGHSEWPARIFRSETVAAVVAVSKKQDSGSVSLNSRIVAVTFEYLVLAHEAHRLRVLRSLGKDVAHFLEVSCQLIVGGFGKKSLTGFQPGLNSLAESRIREFTNDLLEIGGDRIYTPLALMCLPDT